MNVSVVAASPAGSSTVNTSVWPPSSCCVVSMLPTGVLSPTTKTSTATPAGSGAKPALRTATWATTGVSHSTVSDTVASAASKIPSACTFWRKLLSQLRIPVVHRVRRQRAVRLTVLARRVLAVAHVRDVVRVLIPQRPRADPRVLRVPEHGEPLVVGPAHRRLPRGPPGVRIGIAPRRQVTVPVRAVWTPARSRHARRRRHRPR